ncbi:oligopeptide transporter 4-like [Gossypium australe]|uniref:Oligopeptide transporter 4-like n=1 Tax=Gossypium australe TaxID=47621 RepID=A0A5B6VUU5_9ROSI|nr:oligopeptide transporter 4-like [Gossypium australe]
MVQESITRPTITSNNFEIKSTMIKMIQNNLQFRGTMKEDPNQFLQLCDTLKCNEVTNDAIRLWLFPFSLIDNTFSWLDSKAVQLGREIAVFRQVEGESFYEVWERFKMLIKKCTHHGFPDWMRLQIFYNRLDANARSGLDGAAGGPL